MMILNFINAKRKKSVPSPPIPDKIQNAKQSCKEGRFAQVIVLYPNVLAFFEQLLRNGSIISDFALNHEKFSYRLGN